MEIEKIELPIQEGAKDILNKIHLNTSNVLKSWSMKKENVDLTNLSEEEFNELGKIEGIVKKYEKANRELRMEITRPLDAFKSKVVAANEKPLIEIASKISTARNLFAAEKLKKEQEAQRLANIKAQNDKLFINELARVKSELEGAICRIITKALTDTEKAHASLKTDDERHTLLSRLRSMSAHMRDSKIYETELGKVLINSKVRTRVRKAISNEFDFEVFREKYLEVAGTKFIELADKLESGCTSESIVQETQEQLAKAKQILEDERVKNEIEAEYNQELSNQPAAKIKNSQIVKKYEGGASKAAYAKAFALYLASEKFNPKKLDFMVQDALRRGIELEGAEYKETAVVKSNSTVI